MRFGRHIIAIIVGSPAHINYSIELNILARDYYRYESWVRPSDLT